VVKIRLARFGSKKKPIYRIVVADVSAPRDGAAVEYIGRYDPRPNPSVIEIDAERAKHWLARGAQPSQPVRRLLQKQGIPVA
jgi:small subunit ribosomal protein S16